VISRLRIPELNGIRGIAILLVLFVHLTVILPESAGARALLRVAIGGWAGVELFFVLSGFLITGILADTVGKPGFLRSFYARRALRILPLYYLVTIISFVVLPLIETSKSARFATVGDDQIWYWLMLPNVAIAHASGFRHGIMDVTWSVAIEEHFYLVWPVMLLLLKGRGRVIFCASVFAASLALRSALTLRGFDANNLYVLTPTHLDGLAAGSLIALLIRSEIKPATQVIVARALLVIGAAGFAGCVAGGRTPDYYANPWVLTGGIAFLAIGFSGVILRTYLARNRPSLGKRILASRALVAFGLYSYALYLFNLPLRALIRDTVLTPESFSGFPGGVMIGQFTFYLVAGGVCFLVAFASYHLFEKHFLRLKRRFPAPSRERLVSTSPLQY
jgi:peptidoglycan/LPS O-acetylase OafA/YrhL